MPHIVIEAAESCRAEIESTQLLKKLHECMGNFVNIVSVKSRVIYPDSQMVGDGETSGFIHVTLALLAGRPVELRQQIGQSLYQILSEFRKSIANPQMSLSLELREMDAETYVK